MNKRPYISHVLEVRYSDAGVELSGIESQMKCVFELLRRGCGADPLLAPERWLVATGERESSRLYPAFDAEGPAQAALALLREENKGDPASKSFALWNGEESPTLGASISCRFGRKDGRSSSLAFAMRSAPNEFRLGSSAEALLLVKEAVRIFRPIYCGLSPEQYESVFPDRPGAGWMVYLQKALSTVQIPEARSLIAVQGLESTANKRQSGTIVVSVADQPFSDENPDHIAIANAIEIRLVDQDLLPRFSEL